MPQFANESRLAPPVFAIGWKPLTHSRWLKERIKVTSHSIGSYYTIAPNLEILPVSHSIFPLQECLKLLHKIFRGLEKYSIVLLSGLRNVLEVLLVTLAKTASNRHEYSYSYS